ncbi:hypothetical protein [Hathewaya massiliensis]|uniref:hypothetical protein n=1 Tax=Hathewaya massiliensis TaxID=1964382 RepID=UPI00163BA7E3|nr:hypothetical protein [Hathewaya massiliensis]
MEMPILLLQATIPASWNEIRTILVEEFQKRTNSLVKRVEATHLLHWDNPCLIADEVIEWMK